jgi:hypothetical protein
VGGIARTFTFSLADNGKKAQKVRTDAGTPAPNMTIGEMVRSIGLLELDEEMARVRRFYQAAGVQR